MGQWTTTDFVYVAAECATGILSVWGNILVLAAIKRFRSLHTPTNYLIGSLAASDILVGLFIPPSVILSYMGLPKNFQGCTFLNSAVVLLTNISILGLLLIALDRFLAIKHPFLYHRIMDKRRATFAIAVTWVVAILIGLIPVMGWHKEKEGFIVCAFMFVIDLRYMVYLIFFGITVPLLLVMLLIYLYIFHVIHKQHQAMAMQTSVLKQAHTRKLKGIIALAVVIILFAVCWLPIHIINCVLVFAPEIIVPFEFVLVAIVLSHVNSALNPFLYAFTNSKFKFAMIRTGLCQPVVDADTESRRTQG